VSRYDGIFELCATYDADGGTASEYGGLLRICSRGQATRGGPPGWGLGEVLTTPHRKKVPCYETLYRASDLAGSCECGNEPSGSIKRGEFLD
jgi:hypothetical protein